MQIFVINLERSEDRLEHFRGQAITADVTFERIPAVDGRELSQDEVDRQSAESCQFKPLNSAEFGLFASHKKAWERLLASGDRHAAIFEDDAILAPELGRILEDIDTSGMDFDILKLETTFRPVVISKDSLTLPSGHELSRLWSWHGGTAGYVISAKCARRMLSLKQKICDPIDQVLFNPLSNVSAGLQVLQITPAVCVQNDFLPASIGGVSFGSTIQQRRSRLQFCRYGVLVGVRRLFQRLSLAKRSRALLEQNDKKQLTIPFNQNHLRKSA